MVFVCCMQDTVRSEMRRGSHACGTQLLCTPCLSSLTCLEGEFVCSGSVFPFSVLFQTRHFVGSIPWHLALHVL